MWNFEGVLSVRSQRNNAVSRAYIPLLYRLWILTNSKKEGILCSGTKEPLYSLGITELVTPGGNRVRGYCEERTLCDILKPRNHTDVQVVTDAFKRYSSRKEKNIPLLSEYAKKLKVEEKLRSYLEVLL